MTTEEYKAGSFPNLEKLTALLNQQKYPRRMLQAIVSLAVSSKGDNGSSYEQKGGCE